MVDIDPARAAQVAADIVARFGAGRAKAGTDLAAAIATADGLINTTPVGMAKFPGMPIPAGLLRPDLWVAEIIYFPLETELLRSARALGCRTLDGGGMAVFQAVEAFRLITGVTPDAERMLATSSPWLPAEPSRKADLAISSNEREGKSHGRHHGP